MWCFDNNSKFWDEENASRLFACSCFCLYVLFCLNLFICIVQIIDKRSFLYPLIGFEGGQKWMEIPLAITNSNNLCFLSYSVPVLLRLSILLIFPTNLFGLNFHTWPLCSSWFLLLFFWLGFINFINLSENQFLVFLISL